MLDYKSVVLAPCPFCSGKALAQTATPVVVKTAVAKLFQIF